MSKRLSLLAGAAMALCLSLPATAEDTPTADTVVATVNGQQITLGQMILMRASLPQQYSQLPDDVLFDGILNQLVQQTILAETVEGTPRRVEMAVQNERRQLMAAEAIDALLSGEMTDAALQAAYDEKYGNAEPDMEWDASHILVETEELAQKLSEEAAAGTDFAELAKANSTGPSGPNGGQLGWFGKGMMVPEFETAVADMEKGGISAPVQTQFGWHVIRLNDTRLKDAPPLEEVRGELEAELQRALVEGHIEKLTESATIDKSGIEGLDRALLSNTDLLEK